MNKGEWVVFSDIKTGRLRLGEVTDIIDVMKTGRFTFTIESILNPRCLFQTSTDKNVSKPPDFASHEIEYIHSKR